MTETVELNAKAVTEAHATYAKTCGGMLDGQPMENAIRAYLSLTRSDPAVRDRVTDEMVERAYVAWLADTHAEDWEVDEIKSLLRTTLTAALRTSPPEPASGLLPEASCPGCNGTGDQGGNPSYGACDDCDGSGRTPPAKEPK